MPILSNSKHIATRYNHVRNVVNKILLLDNLAKTKISKLQIRGAMCLLNIGAGYGSQLKGFFFTNVKKVTTRGDKQKWWSLNMGFPLLFGWMLLKSFVVKSIMEVI